MEPVVMLQSLAPCSLPFSTLFDGDSPLKATIHAGFRQISPILVLFLSGRVRKAKKNKKIKKRERVEE